MISYDCAMRVPSALYGRTERVKRFRHESKTRAIPKRVCSSENHWCAAHIHECTSYSPGAWKCRKRGSPGNECVRHVMGSSFARFTSRGPLSNTTGCRLRRQRYHVQRVSVKPRVLSERNRVRRADSTTPVGFDTIRPRPALGGVETVSRVIATRSYCRVTVDDGVWRATTAHCHVVPSNGPAVPDDDDASVAPLFCYWPVSPRPEVGA